MVSKTALLRSVLCVGVDNVDHVEPDVEPDGIESDDELAALENERANDDGCWSAGSAGVAATLFGFFECSTDRSTDRKADLGVPSVVRFSDKNDRVKYC